jgi:mono/diheme cytochrome c family protein
MKVPTLVLAAMVLVSQAKTTDDGVFTEAQAERGGQIYTRACASCHADDLSGGGQAPPLADNDFKAEWNNQPVADLFERIRATMPADAPGSLKLIEVADVTAFLLSKCHAPAGHTELPADASPLRAITFVTPK